MNLIHHNCCQIIVTLTIQSTSNLCNSTIVAVGFSRENFTVSEGDGVLNITVVSSMPTHFFTILFSTHDNTATEGKTWNCNELVQRIQVPRVPLTP